MNKKYLKIIPLGIMLIVSTWLITVELSHTFPEMTGKEFHERFDDEDIVKHFKLTYPESAAGAGNNAVMLMPAWGHISANGSIVAELRVQDNFGKYEFTYFCGDIADTYVSVNIKNPTMDDIDNNLCW